MKSAATLPFQDHTVVFEEKLHLNFMTSKYSRAYCTAQREGEGVREQKALHMRGKRMSVACWFV